MHHGHKRFRGRGVGRRWYEAERVLERLEEYQRDLEQEIADVADVIQHLKGDQPTETGTV